MNDNAKTQPDSRAAAMLELQRSGRNWAAIRDAARFQKPAPLFDQPLEISLAMLRGLRMVDETVVVHGDLERAEGQP